MDTTADIQAAINSIPAKKEDLRKAFEELQSCSLFFPSLQWKNIDDHFSSIEKSIDKRFQEIKSRGSTEKPTASLSAANVQVDHDTPVIEICPEVKSLCVEMDAKGLKAYIIGHWKDIQAIRKELGPALLCSPDPVTLVLDAYEGLDGSSGKKERGIPAIGKAYLTILECFHGLKLEVKPSEKERARLVAKNCDDLIKNGKRNDGVVVKVFLHLLAAFGLFEDFVADDVLDLLVTVAGNQKILDLCRNSALEVRIPDLIGKLNKMGRQLVSIKFVVAFNLKHQFPPASLFKAYIKESMEGVHNVAKKGKKSALLELEAAVSREIAAIRAVMKAMKEHRLKTKYLGASLQDRLERLEKLRSERKIGPSRSSVMMG